LYWTPPSIYVARLFGECNVLEGRCLSITGDEAEVAILGRTVALRRGPGVRAHEQASVLVRPEAVDLHPAREVDESHGWGGTVLRVSDVARDLRVTTRIDSSEVVIDAHPRSFAPVVGDRVVCVPDWRRAWSLAYPTRARDGNDGDD